MKRWIWPRIPLAIAIAVCLAPGSAECHETPETPHRRIRILSLETLPSESLWTVTTERIYRERLGDALGDRLEYYYERLDAYNFTDSAYESEFEDYLLRKYRDRPIDLLIAGGMTAATLAGHLQARLAAKPPIIFQGIFTSRPVPKSTGVKLEYSLKESLGLALRVHPETRHVFILLGSGAIDKWYEHEFQSQVPAAPPGVDFTYVRGLSVPALVARLAALPPRSVVLLISLTSDSEGRQYRTASIVGRLAAATTAPIYTYVETMLGIGAFGGRVLSPEPAAEKVAQLALRVVRGEPPEDIPLTALENVDALDWRQLKRWNVSEARIPPGVELRYREPSIYEQYRGYILGAFAVVLLQSVLITGLLIQRRNRRRAERSLRESEERFRVMADTAPVLVWRASADQCCDFFNKPWLEFRGRDVHDELGDGWTEGVHPDDLSHCLKVYREAWPGRQPFRMEYRLRRADGEYRWVLDSGVPRLAADGTLLGYIGSCIDITDRRAAEAALLTNEAALRQSHAEIRDLAGRLITAQEEERARIARDLHDDVTQRLAGISIAISECKRLPGMDTSPELLELLRDAQRQTIGVAEDLRLLSHDLHPEVIRHAGFADAVRSHCQEFASQHVLDIAVEADTEVAITDTTTALCLYRIVQETLRNIDKHANARHVRVTVRRMNDDVQLTVVDDGRGFHLGKVREQGNGLGLRSIEERVRLVGGQLSIETAPDRGTTITVRVKAVASATHDFVRI